MEEFRNILMKNQFSSDEHNIVGDHLIKAHSRYDMTVSSVQEQLNTANMLSCAVAVAVLGLVTGDAGLQWQGAGAGQGTRGKIEQEREHWTRCDERDL